MPMIHQKAFKKESTMQIPNILLIVSTDVRFHYLSLFRLYLKFCSDASSDTDQMH